MIKLFRKHKINIGLWMIWSDADVIYYSHGVIDGAMNTHTEKVELNQSGRSLAEQIELQINSRVSRMLDKGYKYSLEDAMNSPTNQLGLLRPMLAMSLDKVNNINARGAMLQRKLDGHRCLITRDGDDVIAYSRQGKIIDTIDHILEPIKSRIPDGVTIDGELYFHGEQLQTIASWIKRKQQNTSLLKFVAYDLISKDFYTERLKELQSILPREIHPKRVVVLGAVPYTTEESMWNYFGDCKERGFEGAMLRLAGYGYEDGSRSKSLIKIKSRHDEEFKVISVRPSKDGWAILECEIKPGLTFDVSAPGSVPEKTRVLIESEKYIGRLVTVEYANLTKDGKPFHAVATRWRVDV